MAKQWVFAFIGGRFDGYRHVADPRQVGPNQKPPDELYLWENEAMIRVREVGEDDIDTSEAERYCLRSIQKASLEARYEHESLRTEDHGEVPDVVPLRTAERELEPMAA